MLIHLDCLCYYIDFLHGCTGKYQTVVDKEEVANLLGTLSHHHPMHLLFLNPINDQFNKTSTHIL